VPLGVVDALEVIDVEHEEAERRLRPAGPCQLGLEPLLERPAVQRTGQRVARRQFTQAGHELAHLLAQREEHRGDQSDDRGDGDEGRRAQVRLDPGGQRQGAGREGEGEVERDLAPGEEVRGHHHRPEVEDRRQPDRGGERDHHGGRDRAERADRTEHHVGGRAPRGEAERHEGEHRRTDQQPAAVRRIWVGSGERGHDRHRACPQKARPGKAQPRAGARTAAWLTPTQRIGDDTSHPTSIGRCARRL
jgi:hypothetical protein